MPRHNQVRARTLDLLEQNGEMRATDICDVLDIRSSALSQSMRVAVRDGMVLQRREGSALFYSLPGAPEPEAPQEFRVARWDDGDIDIYGAAETESGGVRLTPDMVAKLRKVLAPLEA